MSYRRSGFDPESIEDEATQARDIAAAVDWVPSPRAPELLGSTAGYMHGRATTCDTPDGKRSMGKAVAAFNAITGRNLSEADGWLLMQVLNDVWQNQQDD